MFRKNYLLTRLIFSIVAVFLFFQLLFGSITYLTLYFITRSDTLYDFKTNLTLTETDIKNYVSIPANLLRDTKKFLTSYQDEKGLNTIKVYIANILRTFNHISRVRIIGNNGFAVLDSNADILPEKINYKYETFFITRKSEGEIQWNNVYVSEFNNNPSIAMSISLCDYLIVADIDISETSKLISSDITHEIGTITILDEYGNYLIDADNSKVAQRNQHPFFTEIKKLSQNKDLAYAKVPNTNNLIVARKFIDDSIWSGWYIVIEIEGNIFRRSLSAFINSQMIATLLYVFVAVIILNTIVKRLTADFSLLVRKTKIMAEGENYQADTKSNWNYKEVSELNSNFNSIMELVKKRESQLSQVNEFLEESESRIRAILEMIPDKIVIFNKDYEILSFYMKGNHRKFVYMFTDSMIGRKLDDVLPEDLVEITESHIDEVFRTKQQASHEYSVKKGNTTRYYEVRLVFVNNSEVMAIVRDITSSKKTFILIDNLSKRDQLTNLHNRRYFEEEVKNIDNAANYPLSLIIIDVNGLKLTNDAFGHMTGDHLLILVAETINRASTRNNAVTARIGGDEFIILSPNTDTEDSFKIIENLYKMTSEIVDEPFLVSVSAGYAVKYNSDEPFSKVFAKAENMMYHSKLYESQSMRNRTIGTIMNTLNEKSEQERKHSVAVSYFCKMIATAMNLDIHAIKEIETTGLLHDIGKIAVNEALLNKPWKLTPEEYKEVKKHVESGYQILKSADIYFSLAENVLHHHERWDGQWYPQGLKSTDIPLISRIIAVADAYEAMIADRPYRKGISHEEAVNVLRENSGKQFDPDITKIFIDVLDNQKEIISEINQ